MTPAVHQQARRRASLTLQQAIYRDENRQHLIQATVRIAALNAHFKPTRLPPMREEKEAP